jgi:LysM repeat protein
LQEKQEKERSKEKEVKEEEKSLLLFNNNNKEKKEVVVVDVEKEKKNKEFFKVDKNEVEDYLAKYCREHQIGLEAWLQKNKLDDVEDFKNYARQVFTEWELTHESEHEDEKSLLRHLFNQIRIKIKSEKQERHENNSGSAWQNFQQRWARPKPAYGLIE